MKPLPKRFWCELVVYNQPIIFISCCSARPKIRLDYQSKDEKVPLLVEVCSAINLRLLLLDCSSKILLLSHFDCSTLFFFCYQFDFLPLLPPFIALSLSSILTNLFSLNLSFHLFFFSSYLFTYFSSIPKQMLPLFYNTYHSSLFPVSAQIHNWLHRKEGCLTYSLFFSLSFKFSFSLFSFHFLLPFLLFSSFLTYFFFFILVPPFVFSYFTLTSSANKNKLFALQVKLFCDVNSLVRIVIKLF